jgi:hypothetical protein
MNNTRLIYAVFSVIVGVLLFGTWSNIQVYAQQSSTATPPATASSPSTTTISPEIKAKMCDPSNPSLKVVNTTEARICAIPKTVKPSLPAATPPTSAVSSSESKSSPLAASVAAPKQQKMIASNNNNAITPTTASQLPKQTGAGKETTAMVAPVRNVSNKSLLSSPSSTIAPQVNAITKQQQQQHLLTVSNVTAGQNHTFAVTSPAVTPGKLINLGYQGSSTASDSSLKDKHSSHIKSSSHNDDDSKSSSNIENDISSVIMKSFNFKHSKHSDSSDNGRVAASSSSSAAVAGDDNDDGGHKHKDRTGASSSSSAAAAAGGGSAAASSSASALS